jgi:hypothetical protein
MKCRSGLRQTRIQNQQAALARPEHNHRQVLGDQNQFGPILPLFDVLWCEDNVVGWIDEVCRCVGLDMGNDQERSINSLIALINTGFRDDGKCSYQSEKHEPIVRLQTLEGLE